MHKNKWFNISAILALTFLSLDIRAKDACGKFFKEKHIVSPLKELSESEISFFIKNTNLAIQNLNYLISIKSSLFFTGGTIIELATENVVENKARFLLEVVNELKVLGFKIRDPLYLEHMIRHSNASKERVIADIIASKILFPIEILNIFNLSGLKQRLVNILKSLKYAKKTIY
jgi:hypothetical protein